MNTLIKALLFGGGVYLLYRTGILSSISGGIIPSPGVAVPAAGAGAPAAAGPPAFNSLLNTGQRVQAEAILDYQGGDRSNQLSVTSGVPSTTWDAWNYFLNKQTAFTDLPDYRTVTGQPDTGQPMTFAQYWQLMSPWLTKNHGMTGVPPEGLGWYGYPAHGMGGWQGVHGVGRAVTSSGLSGWVRSFPDRRTPQNLFRPNVRLWGF